MKKPGLVAALVVVGMFSPMAANAVAITVSNAQVQEVDSDIGNGDCYVVLDKAIGGVCSGTSVSFDCKGKFLKAGEGNRHYSTAMLAFSLNKPVNLWVNDANRYGGMCVADRISIIY